MSLHLYLKWRISYVLQVTNYWYQMKLFWVELDLIIWISRLKLRIMGLSFRYTLWFVFTFSSSMMLYYWFVYSHNGWFISRCIYSVVNIIQVVIYAEVRYIQVIHIPMGEFRIYVSTQCLFLLFVWGLWFHI